MLHSQHTPNLCHTLAPKLHSQLKHLKLMIGDCIEEVLDGYTISMQVPTPGAKLAAMAYQTHLHHHFALCIVEASKKNTMLSNLESGPLLRDECLSETV